MKSALALLVAMGVMAFASPQEAQAQFYRGGSGFAISVGSGFNRGFGGFNSGFGGFNSGFNSFNRGGFNSFNRGFGGSSYYRPSYGRSYGGGGFGRGCGY